MSDKKEVIVFDNLRDREGEPIVVEVPRGVIRDEDRAWVADAAKRAAEQTKELLRR